MKMLKTVLSVLGVAQALLLAAKLTGLVAMRWCWTLLPLEIVFTAVALLFLYLLACLVEDIKNGVFTDCGGGDNGKE